MFRRPEESRLKKIIKTIDIEWGGGPCGLHFAPFALLASIIIPLICSGSFLMSNLSKRSSFSEQWDSRGCNKGPLTILTAAKCDQINDMISDSDQKITFFLGAFVFFLAIMGFLAQRSCRKYLADKTHPHHKIAAEFYKRYPDYPENVEEKIMIDCPISYEESAEAVCVSFEYKGKKHEHAYDYKTLITWFLKEHGKICPASNIDLLSGEVTNFKISFDIPENVTERVNRSLNQSN